MAAACSLAIGCSLVTLNQSEEALHGGKAIDPQIFNEIEPGTTTTQWLLRYVGHPNQVIKLQANKEQYLYRIDRKDTNSVNVFLLYSKRSSKTLPEWYVVEVMEDKVTDIWRKEPKLPPQEKPAAESSAAEQPAGSKSLEPKPVEMSQAQTISETPKESDIQPASSHQGKEPQPPQEAEDSTPSTLSQPAGESSETRSSSNSRELLSV